MNTSEALSFIKAAQPDGTHTERCILRALAQVEDPVARNHIQQGLTLALRFGASVGYRRARRDNALDDRA